MAAVHADAARKTGQIDETLAAAEAEVERLFGVAQHVSTRARTRLEEEKLAVGTEAGAAIATSAGRSGQNSQRCLAQAIDLLTRAEHLVSEVIDKVKRPKNPVWMDAEGEGCVLGISLVVVGIVGALAGGFTGFLFGAAVLYVAVMVLRAITPTNSLRKAYGEVEGHVAAARRLITQASAAAVEEARGPRTAAEEEARGPVARARAEAEQKTAAARERRRTALDQLEHTLLRQLGEHRTQCLRLAQKSGLAGADWSDPLWAGWRPSQSPDFGARFGSLESATSDLARVFPSLPLPVSLPALMPFTDGRGLYLEAGASHRAAAAGAVQSLLSRLFATVPPGKVWMTFFDPVGLGNHVAAFMPLADAEESLINSRAWSEPAHIEQRLADITEHMETVIQKYLRTDYPTIHDYNAAAGEVAEPFRVVVAFDFPVNFTDTAARRLVSIARNGARCGVYVVVVIDPAKRLPYDFDTAELARICEVLVPTPVQDGSRFQWQTAACGGWTVLPDEAPSNALLQPILKQIGEKAKDNMRVEVPFDKLLGLAGIAEEKWWHGNTAGSIRVPLGTSGARRLQYLTLGEGLGHHALIVGRPGSGKSNLMHVIITTLALIYPPEEMQFYLIDFKKGVEFKSYAEHKLPHALAIAVESEREFGFSVIQRLDVELKERGDSFRAAGAANITEYRQKTGRQIPRVLLLIDEFQELFTEDDDISRQTTLLLDRLVRQGRAFGLHVLLGSQTLAGSYNLSRATLDQMAIRIAMQCSETDSRLILADDNPAARLLSRPGEAIYNSSSGLVEGNNLFQAAVFKEDEDHARILRAISTLAHRRDVPPSEPLVFEGSEMSRTEDCRPLRELLDAPGRPAAARSVDLFLGEPIAIRPPVAARLRRQSGQNLLLVNRREDEAMGMCIGALWSILAQKPPGTARIHVADFTTADCDWSEDATHIAKFFPGQISIVKRRQRDFPGMLKGIQDELTAQPESSAASTFVVLLGMHRIKALREDEEDEDGINAVETLAALLRDGPESGLHVIAWVDTWANATRGLSRKAMQEFGLRVAAAMSNQESNDVLESDAASRLSRPHRAIFFDEEKPGQLVTFRPYALSPAAWRDETGQKLQARANAAGT